MKALVDTTVFADALLKTRQIRKNAKEAIAKFDESIGPVYAFKELKGGPLKNFVWFHNKLALMSYLDAFHALQRSALSPRRYQTATAIEAFTAASEAAGVPDDWIRKYGTKTTNPTTTYQEKLRLSLKKIIKQGWNNRRKLTSRVVCELACYPETPVTELENRTLEVEPIACDTRYGCALARKMSSELETIKKMIVVVEAADQKGENVRRARALRKLTKQDGWKSFTNDDCRALGDAAIAFLTPSDSTILTTNTRDLEPLAIALGKSVTSPPKVVN